MTPGRIRQWIAPTSRRFRNLSCVALTKNDREVASSPVSLLGFDVLSIGRNCLIVKLYLPLALMPLERGFQFQFFWASGGCGGLLVRHNSPLTWRF